MNELPVCPIPIPPDFSGVTEAKLTPQQPLKDYLEAMRVANDEADSPLGAYMQLSWYDRARDFDSPPHPRECHENSAVPGYVDYGLFHGAKLKVDIEAGRFVLFYMPVDS